jgi:hypothetical protein
MPMTFKIGLLKLMNPPLHRKYKERDSLRYIRNRYRGMKGQFDEQVALLQSDDAFLDRCGILYRDGYKDWHILSAIMNRMIAVEAERRQIDQQTSSGRQAYQDLAKNLSGVILPASNFEGRDWDFAFELHAVTCLQTYGFEIRNPRLDTKAVVRFLRERMLHFEHDIPHAPMFGRPPAPWPKV